MISRTVRIQLAIFLVLSFVGIVYTGFAYVGITSVGPVHFSPGPYTVKMQLADSGGIYTTAPVTYRGVQVGEVGALHLTDDGVEIDLKIDHDVKIPTDTTAAVANLSAVGEQYVDITPQSDSGPYMNAGFVIPRSSTSIPVQDSVLLQNLDTLVNSVNRQNLATVISELGQATDGTGPSLQRLIDSGNALLGSAQTALPQTLKLIDDGRTVLNTQADVAGNLRSYSRDLDLLTRQLVTSDASLRSLFDNGVASAQQLQALLAANRANLPPLLANLNTLGLIQAQRLPGIQEVLVLYPFIVSDAYTALTNSDGTGGATAQFAAALSTTALPCNFSNASGYQSTTPHNENPNSQGNPVNGQGRPTTFQLGGPANLNTLCTGPDQAPNGTTGTAGGTSEARGAATAPRPAGDGTGTPGGAVGTTGNQGQSNYRYTPASSATSRSGGRAFTLDGGEYTLGSQVAQPAGYAGSSLRWFLLSGLAG